MSQVASTPPRPTPTPTSTAPAPAPAQRAAHPLLSRASRPTAPPVLAPVVNLFDDDEASSFAPTPTPAAISTHQGTGQPPPTVAATAPVSQSTAPPAPTQPSTSIFDLDFRAPSTTAKPQTAKADIMSLFSNTTPSSAPSTASPNQGSFFSPSGNSAAIPATNPYSSWGGGVTSSAPPVQTQPTQTSTAGWGMQVDQNAWGAPPVQSQASQGSAGQSGWAGNAGGAAGGSGVGADPWANTGNVNAGNIGGFASPPVVAKKDERDPFANIWG
jgi:stromal membrane-associated protein